MFVRPAEGEGKRRRRRPAFEVFWGSCSRSAASSLTFAHAVPGNASVCIHSPAALTVPCLQLHGCLFADPVVLTAAIRSPSSRSKQRCKPTQLQRCRVGLTVFRLMVRASQVCFHLDTFSFSYVCSQIESNGRSERREFCLGAVSTGTQRPTQHRRQQVSRRLFLSSRQSGTTVLRLAFRSLRASPTLENCALPGTRMLTDQ